jgi:hypothetical protein
MKPLKTLLAKRERRLEGVVRRNNLLNATLRLHRALERLKLSAPFHLGID